MGNNDFFLVSQDLVHVDLDIVLSPASSVYSKVKEVGDNVCIGVAFGAVGVLAVSVFAPITASVAMGTGVATGVTGLYGLFTSSSNLVDRNKHEQVLLNFKFRACLVSTVMSLNHSTYYRG